MWSRLALVNYLISVAAGRTDSSGTNPSSDVVTTQMNYAYDDFGRKLRETDALGRSWTFGYNPYGDVVQITDPKNQTTQLSYFRSSHQLETRIDHEGNQTTYWRNPLGQVSSAASPAATTTYEYDKAHRLASATDSRSGQSVAYRYSPGGLLNQMQVGASVTDYLYDPVGRLTGIWAPSNDLIAYAYDRGGRVTEQWLPNGANTRYSYNADNTVQQIINRNKNGAIISQHDYTYDAGGHRLTHLESIAGTTTPYKYVYDELARLTEVRHNSTNALIEGYGYDPLGNRTTKTDGTTTLAYLYDAANQLKEIRQGSDTGALLASLGYDPNGNLTSKSEGATTTTLTYDALNRLIQAAKTGQPVQTYVYDAEGRRIQKTVGSTPTQYLYNGPDILAEYGASWTATATYTHGPKMDDPILRATASGTQYYHQDGLGSVVALSDATGGITGTARYDAWGNPLAMTGAVPQYGYTGREPDETGLIYYRGRYYDPAIGRFTQPDPIGLQGGMNLYAYVNNNPTNFTDPWGLTPRMVFETGLSVNASYYIASTDGSGGFNSGNQSLATNSGLQTLGSFSGIQNMPRGSGTTENGYAGLEGKVMQLAELLIGPSVKETINQYSHQIIQAADQSNVSPSMIKAIIYEEQTHLKPFESTLEQLGAGNTVGLGQITVGKYGYSREQLLQPETNIQAIAQHLNVVQNQLINKGIEPTPAAVGTLYNCGSCTSISNYGRRIENFYIRHENE